MSKINNFIKKALQRKQKESINFSLRSLSIKLKVPHSFLSNLLNNKKKWPLKLIDEIVEILEMDDLSKNRLAQIMIDEQLAALKKSSLLLKKYNSSEYLNSKQNREDPLVEYFEEPSDSTQILAHWYFISLMDLTSCSNFKLDFDWISKRLGISTYEAEFAWQFLISNKYISQKNGKWVKNESSLRIPTIKSHDAIRKYHQTMIQKGVNLLSQKNANSSFTDRLIAGLSVPTNLANISDAKQILHDAAYQSASALNKGPCSEVFQIEIMIFPVSLTEKSVK